MGRLTDASNSYAPYGMCEKHERPFFGPHRRKCDLCIAISLLTELGYEVIAPGEKRDVAPPSEPWPDTLETYMIDVKDYLRRINQNTAAIVAYLKRERQ